MKIENLNKFYGTFKALDNFELNVVENQVYGFIGRNGAGKTTTLNAVMQFIDFDSGTIYFDGKPLNKDDVSYKEFIAFVPDVPSFPSYLKGREVLALTADFIGIEASERNKRIKEVIERTDIKYPNKKVGQYSRGMRQRLAIASALLKKPKLLIMDEPTSALDPLGRKELLDLIRSLKSETTILYSTHILGDAQGVCDKIGLIENGRLVLEGDMDEILRSKVTNAYVVECERLDEVYKLLSQHAPFVDTIEKTQRGITFTLKENAKQRDIYRLFSTYDVHIDKLYKQSQSLEDVFVEVLNNENSV